LYISANFFLSVKAVLTAFLARKELDQRIAAGESLEIPENLRDIDTHAFILTDYPLLYEFVFALDEMKNEGYPDHNRVCTGQGNKERSESKKD
jgi:hypothetical protein